MLFSDLFSILFIDYTVIVSLFPLFSSMVVFPLVLRSFNLLPFLSLPVCFYAQLLPISSFSTTCALPQLFPFHFDQLLCFFPLFPLLPQSISSSTGSSMIFSVKPPLFSIFFSIPPVPFLFFFPMMSCYVNCKFLFYYFLLIIKTYFFNFYPGSCMNLLKVCIFILRAYCLV